MPAGLTAVAATDRESFDTVVERRTPTVGNLLQGQDGWLFPVRVPVVRDGRAKYVLTAVLTPATLARA